MRVKLKSIGDAVMATDAEGRVTLMNPAAEKFCGVTEAVAHGKKHEDFFRIVNYENGLPVASPVRRVLATGETVELANHTDLIALDGTRRHIADSASPIPGPDGRVSGAILVFRDVTDEYNRRDQIREMNENFRISAEMAHVTLFRFQPETRKITGITDLGDTVPVQSGYLPPFEEWVVPEDVPLIKKYIRNILDGKICGVSNPHRTTHTGAVRHFRCFLRKEENSNGELIGVMQETTEYIEQENTLRRTREMWDVICNTLPLCFFVKDIDDHFRYLMANEKSAAVVHTTVENMIGKTDRELFLNPIDCERIESDDQALVKSGGTLQSPETTFDSDGRTRHFQTIKTVCVGPDGRRLLVGVSMDITESVKLDTELQKTREMWKLIGDALPVSLFALNADDQFRYVMVNQNFANFVGVSVEDLIGKNCRDIYSHEEDWKAFERNDQEIASSGEPRDFEETAFDCHGNPVELRTIISPVPGPSGEHLLVGISMDVTEEKHRAHQLSVFNSQLQRYAEQDQFQKQCMAELLVATDFREAMGRIAAMLGKCVNSSAVNLMKQAVDERGVRLVPELRWSRDGEVQPSDILDVTFYVSRHSKSYKELMRNGFLHLVRADLKSDSPERAALAEELRPYFERMNCVELVCAPVIFHRRFWGCIGAVSYDADRMMGESADRVIVSSARMVELLLSRKEGSDELVRSEREKRLLLDILPLPVVVLSKESRILLHNQSFVTLIGAADSDLTGSLCLHRICGSEICNPELCPLHLTLSSSQPRQIEKVIRNRNYMLKTMPVTQTSGTDRVIVIFIDMTEMTRRQELLRTAMEKAKEADQAKSYFLATMSHEIRTPLNAVIGFSELLKDRTLPEDLRSDYLNDISVAGNALLLLINDILDLSKLESDQAVFTKTETVFSELAEEIRIVFTAKLQEKNLRFDLAVGPMPRILADRQRLRQILFNLVGNAVKFTASGSITVSGEFHRNDDGKTGTLVFSVKDTGCGVEAMDRERIFKPFVQVSALRGTRTENGTGLGLAIIRRLLERMNGTITLDSEPGKGSLFTVEIHELPFLESAAAAAPRPPLPFELCRPDARLTRILLVDDVPMNLKVVKAMCDKLGLVHVATANSGTAALELMDKQMFDLVLTDMWMPDMNGAELAAKIKQDQRFADVRIFALTADIEAQDTFDMHYFSSVLLKPVTLEKIVRIVNSTANCAADHPE